MNKHKTIDRDLTSTRPCRLRTSRLERMAAAPCLMDGGAIILCRRGECLMHVDFKQWHMKEGSVMTLFPGDVVWTTEASADFEAETLSYDRAMLRRASLQLERTVYAVLRSDRCRGDSPVVTEIIDCMFRLLRVYFAQADCACLEELVHYQLKAFFTGFYDWVRRNPASYGKAGRPGRTDELFNTFMELLELCYKESHDVAYYAGRMNISAKYLTTIVRRATDHTPKAVIDHYVTLQLKQQLQTTTMSIKEMAWEYKFSDVPFFCRYFKQHAGMTPLQFRKTTTEAR